MEEKNYKKTNWTAYYAKKKSWFSAHGQKYTLKIILCAMETFVKGIKEINILELGGGNSCFAKDICEAENINTYDIIDNNELATNLFNQMNLNAKYHFGYQYNLLDADDENVAECKKYDFVYSVGLVEHFRGEDIKKIIAAHYKYCKYGGIVLITFPTPSTKYIIVRKFMELTGVWQFYDECPIKYENVESIFKKYGTVERYFVNKKLPLTQMVVISKNKYDDFEGI